MPKLTFNLSEPKLKNMEKDSNLILPASIIFAAILISGALFYTKSENKTVEEDKNKIEATGPRINEKDFVLGDPNAKIDVIVYADYQCPFCGRFFENAEKSIRSEYVLSNKVKLAHRNFAFLGEESILAAEAAECAKDQNKFWEYHDKLYEAEIKDGTENNGNLKRSLFLQIASSLGLNSSQFSFCVDSRKYKARVEEETREASSYGVNSTPTIFVQGEEIRGAQPFNVFKSAIDSVLNGS